MPRYGFNGHITQMKIFILFIMRHILDQVTLDEMQDMVLIDDNMNYFLFSQSVSELVESELLFKEGGVDGDVYTLSPRGFDTLEPVERTLPISLRRAGQEHARKVLNRLRLRTRVQTEVVERGDEYMAHMTLTDGQDPILHIEMMSGARERADRMCANFQENAEKVFDVLLRALSGG